VIDHGLGRAALAARDGIAQKRVMAVVPSGFDEDSAEMGIVGFGDGALDALDPAGIFRRDQTQKGHDTRSGGKAARIPEFGGNGQRRQIIDAAEAAEALDASAERLEAEKIAELEFDRRQLGDALLDRPDIGVVGLSQRGPIPALRVQPLGVLFRPRALGEEEPSPSRNRKWESRWRARSRSARTCSRQRRRSRTASSSFVGM
jgi:hypothetical protein